MHLLARRERGQAVVEFGIIATVLFVFTLGLLDVGRAFYQYNVVVSAAQYGARFGAVEGGTCSDVLKPPTAGDWCNRGTLAGMPLPAACSTPPSGAPTFWASNGNAPCQPLGTSCPNDLTSFSGYYTVADFKSSSSPSIVGMVAQRFDTTNGSTSVVAGGATPGFDLSQMKVCIQLSIDPYTGQWSYKPGAKVTVFVYYPFSAVGPLFSARRFTLVASSQYTME
jgi:Flp pilus assembly protein TadG